MIATSVNSTETKDDSCALFKRMSPAGQLHNKLLNRINLTNIFSWETIDKSFLRSGKMSPIVVELQSPLEM